FNWGILGRGEGVYRKGFRSRAGIDIALDQRGPSEGNLQRTLQVLMYQADCLIAQGHLRIVYGFGDFQKKLMRRMGDYDDGRENTR
ncbi:MAG: hypothetical protein Q7V48_11290, partial [Deltaproteobacteria bacterium]|nr:hypothetical protein [Deltaproteobacteria bacterium]